MDVVAKAIRAVYKAHKEMKGFNMVYEPEHLCSFRVSF